MSIHDVREIFNVMDIDKNGTLTKEELMETGGLDEAQAQNLIQRLDVDNSGTLSVEELQGILRGIDTSLRNEFRTAFALAGVLSAFAHATDAQPEADVTE